jgi:hypothetical protein
MTPMLAFSCFCLLVGDMSYGFDTNSFGGILGNPVSIRDVTEGLGIPKSNGRAFS